MCTDTCTGACTVARTGTCDGTCSGTCTAACIGGCTAKNSNTTSASRSGTNPGAGLVNRGVIIEGVFGTERAHNMLRADLFSLRTHLPAVIKKVRKGS